MPPQLGLLGGDHLEARKISERVSYYKTDIIELGIFDGSSPLFPSQVVRINIVKSKGIVVKKKKKKRKER